MYGYMVWNNQFKCLGPMKWSSKHDITGKDNGYIYSTKIKPKDLSWNDLKQASSKEGVVFKHRILWLYENDPEKAKKIFEQDFIDNCNEKIKEAQKQLERRIGILYC